MQIQHIPAGHGRAGAALKTGNPRHRKTSAIVACPACAGVGRSAAAYFDRAFGTSASLAAAAEAIADDLGFCERHGRMLSRESTRAGRVAQACAAAIARIEPLLHESVVDERCQRLFFSAGRRCPTCSADEATAGKLLAPIRRGWLRGEPDPGVTDGLCWQHFQSMVRRLPLETRGQAMQHYLGVLDDTERSLAHEPQRGLPSALARLGLSEGSADAGTCTDPQAPAALMKDLLAAPDLCPICEAIGQARRRWLHGLLWSAEHPNAQCLWLFAPCCARHVGDAARLGHAGLTAGVAGLALAGLGKQLRQQLTAIVHELAQAQLPRPVWYRPRRRRRDKAVSALAEPSRRFVLHCQGCEAEAIALERAAAQFLGLMRSVQGRDLLARGHGLCLRHLAHVLPVAPPDAARPFLTELHAARLLALRDTLAFEDNGDAWRRALYRFRGWPGGETVP